jgi:predicted amidohydrolase
MCKHPVVIIGDDFVETIKIAAFPFGGKSGDKEANLEIIKEQSKVAAEKGVKLICFPELALTGGDTEALGMNIFRLAEKADGPVAKQLADIAKSFGIYIAAGMVQASQVPGRLYSTILFAGPEGMVREVYQKRYFDGMDQLYMTGSSAKEAVQHTYPWGRTAMAAGADMERPEFVEKLSAGKNDFILTFAKMRENREGAILAKKCASFVIYTDAARAAVFDRAGRVLAETQENELLISEIAWR